LNEKAASAANTSGFGRVTQPSQKDSVICKHNISHEFLQALGQIPWTQQLNSLTGLYLFRLRHPPVAWQGAFFYHKGK
jgi:hypothetical protein